MAVIDLRFFEFNSVGLADILQVYEVVLAKKTDVNPVGIASLENASSGDVTFFHNKKYLDALQKTKATFVFCKPEDEKYLPESVIGLITSNPYFAYAKAATIMYKEKKSYLEQDSFISQNATIAKSASIGDNVIIGDGCIIEENVVLKNGVKLSDNVVIKANSVIGYGSCIDSGTVVDYCSVVEFAKIGKNCHIYSGAKIGQRGYGFAVDLVKMAVVDVPQLGLVEIGDCVDVGSNTTIDRGAINSSVIGSYTKIDNLVQVAHNVQIGIGCSITSQVGIAGGAEIGNFVTIYGQVGIGGYLKIGDKSTITAQSGVHTNVPESATYSGAPAIDNKVWKRAVAKMLIDAKKFNR